MPCHCRDVIVLLFALARETSTSSAFKKNCQVSWRWKRCINCPIWEFLSILEFCLRNMKKSTSFIIFLAKNHQKFLFKMSLRLSMTCFLLISIFILMLLMFLPKMNCSAVALLLPCFLLQMWHTLTHWSPLYCKENV